MYTHSQLLFPRQFVFRPRRLPTQRHLSPCRRHVAQGLVEASRAVAAGRVMLVSLGQGASCSLPFAAGCICCRLYLVRLYLVRLYLVRLCLSQAAFAAGCICRRLYLVRLYLVRLCLLQAVFVAGCTCYRLISPQCSLPHAKRPCAGTTLSLVGRCSADGELFSPLLSLSLSRSLTRA
jgi:hypothetical protein